MVIVTDQLIPGLSEGIRKLMADLGTTVDLIPLDGSRITAEDVRDADALIVRTRTRCDRELLQDSRVALVGTATIGTDHIDIPWCESQGIRVVNAPGCNAPAVMQYVSSSLQAAGFDPEKHTLGVIGKGHIGSLVTELYRRAGTKVLVSDPPRKDAGLTDEDYLSLDEVLAQSDAVTFHVPYEPGTHHLLTKDLLLKHSRPGTIINASRGAVFQPEVFELDRRFIIDTWPFEDSPEEWTPEKRRRIIDCAFIATPHIAGYSIEGKRRATEAMIKAIAELGKRGEGDVKATADDIEESGHYELHTVTASFDPLPLSEALKKDPASFESLRAAHLRPEPSKNNE